MDWNFDDFNEDTVSITKPTSVSLDLDIPDSPPKSKKRRSTRNRKISAKKAKPSPTDDDNDHKAAEQPSELSRILAETRKKAEMKEEVRREAFEMTGLQYRNRPALDDDDLELGIDIPEPEVKGRESDDLSDLSESSEDDFDAGKFFLLSTLY